MADGSQVRALVARLRTLRRVVVRVDIALSLAQAALWAVLIAIPVVVALQARRRRARQGLAGPVMTSRQASRIRRPSMPPDTTHTLRSDKRPSSSPFEGHGSSQATPSKAGMPKLAPYGFGPPTPKQAAHL